MRTSGLKRFAVVPSLLIAIASWSQPGTLTAGIGKTLLSFHLTGNGSPQYSISFNGRTAVGWSSLGFSMDMDTAFSNGFELITSGKRTVDELWKPVWGEVSQIRNHYQELTISLRSRHQPQRLMNIRFRVFEDGVGFRYEFPKQPSLQYFIIKDELTEFSMTDDHKAFWIPGDFDSNEYLYTTSALSSIDNRKTVAQATDICVRVAPDPFAVQTPLMLKSMDGLYINIHEAALIDYPAMQLHVDTASFRLRSALVPDAVGNKAYLHAPFCTPWRTIIISDRAEDILSSKLILNLNEPSRINKTDWIKPMKFVGVWWELQTARSTWSYSDLPDSLDAKGRLLPNGKHGANTANVKRYIDFAAKNGIDAVLVEGWNTGWEDWFGNWKENVFDFVTPYPDFDVKSITAYARSKGVKMIMHNETSGSATNYERQLDTAYKFMNRFGYPAVKTGYVGRIIPRGEHHDGQWMINHYLRVAEKAAQHQVTIDMHEPVRPTGLSRTYPNWLASEAGRGNEYNAFSYGSPPEHETILPFTRLIGGPMDYTPGIFKLKNFVSSDGSRQLHTTLAKQLALYVTMYSPLQMAADLPENYEARPDAFGFIRHVPVDWDDTKVIEAEPGDYITIARKGKNSSNWFIGAITDENSRTAKIPLVFLDKGKQYSATVYRDGADADWKSNPESYKIETIGVTSDSVLSIELAAGGGCAIEIRPKVK